MDWRRGDKNWDADRMNRRRGRFQGAGGRESERRRGGEPSTPPFVGTYDHPLPCNPPFSCRRGFHLEFIIYSFYSFLLVPLGCPPPSTLYLIFCVVRWAVIPHPANPPTGRGGKASYNGLNQDTIYGLYGRFFIFLDIAW